MTIQEIVNLKKGDKVKWTGENPCDFVVTKVFQGNPQTPNGYEYWDWSVRLKSNKDNKSELVSGDVLSNIHFEILRQVGK